MRLQIPTRQGCLVAARSARAFHRPKHCLGLLKVRRTKLRSNTHPATAIIFEAHVTPVDATKVREKAKVQMVKLASPDANDPAEVDPFANPSPVTISADEFICCCRFICCEPSRDHLTFFGHLYGQGNRRMLNRDLRALVAALRSALESAGQGQLLETVASDLAKRGLQDLANVVRGHE